MIDKARVNYFLAEILDGTELFLVDLIIKPSNKIIIEVDSFKGVSIDECANVSHSLESKLDRNQEDYELEVSSPGLGNPFKVIQQYEKYRGKQIAVVLKNGQKIIGMLLDVSQVTIKVETQEKNKVEGKKKAMLETIVTELLYNEIKSAKAIISF